MAIKTKEELRTYWNASISTNGVQSITGHVMNTGGIDIIDSMAMSTDLVNAVLTGYGTVGEIGNISWSANIVATGTWEKMPFTRPQVSAMKNFSYDAVNDRLVVDFPVAPDTPIEIDLTISMGINPVSATARAILIAHGINGAVGLEADTFYQSITFDTPTASMITPLTYVWRGVVNNGAGIDMFMQSSDTGNFTGRARYITAKGILIQ